MHSTKKVSYPHHPKNQPNIGKKANNPTESGQKVGTGSSQERQLVGLIKQGKVQNTYPWASEQVQPAGYQPVGKCSTHT